MKKALLLSAWLVAVVPSPGSLWAAGTIEPWLRWTRNPLTIPTSVRVTNVLAATNSVVSVTLADGLLNLPARDCNVDSLDYTNGTFTANLQVRRPYRLTVVGTNLTSFDFEITYKRDWMPITRVGRASRPKTYQLLVDGELWWGPLVGYGPPTSCSYYSNTWTIELTERLPVNWRLEDGTDDPRPAPGDGKWPELGPGRSLDLRRTAFAWSVGLGRLMDGTAAGRLSLREASLTPQTYTPTNLFYTASSEVVRDEVTLIPKQPNSPVLRQLKAYQTFVDIVPLTNAPTTELRFYRPQDVSSQTNSAGHYTNFTGNAFVVWAINNPEPSTTNKLHLIERRNGVNRTNELVLTTNSPPTWTLRYGAGNEQRVEKRELTITSTNRTELVDVRFAGAAVPAYRATERYHLFPWGLELIETRIDNPDGNGGTADDLVTQMAYHTNPNVTHTYGKLDSIIYPDGFWEKRIYEDVPDAGYNVPYGGLRQVLTPDRDSPASPASADVTNSIVTQYRYDDWGEFALTEKYYKGEAGLPVPNLLRQDRNMRTWDEWSGSNFSYDGALFSPDLGWIVGQSAFTPDEISGFGYFGHDFHRHDGEGPDEIGYTHGGTLTNGVFTVNGTYPWEGPDFRRCVLFTKELEDSDAPTEYLLVATAQGEMLYDRNGVNGVVLYPRRTWRESAMYQRGSLTQRELHVFTGVDGQGEPQFNLIGKWAYLNDSLGHATNVLWTDGSSGVQRVVYSADYRGGAPSDGDLLIWESDETGVKTTYTYDALKRVVSRTKEGVAAAGGFPQRKPIVTTLGYDAQHRTLGETNSSNGLTLRSTVQYDLNGRPLSQTDTNGLTTNFVYLFGGRQVTKTMPDGTTEIRENYRDRRLKSVTGTGVVAQYHDWEYLGFEEDPRFGAPLDNVRTIHSITPGSPTSTRVAYEGIDYVGRKNWSQTLDWDSDHKLVEYHSYYGEREKKILSVHRPTRGATDPVEAFGYDLDGTTNLVNTLVNPATVWTDPATVNRMVRTATYFTQLTNHWFKCTTNFIYRTDNNATPTLQNARWERLNGFANSNLLSEIVTWDADNQATIVKVTVDRAATKLTEVTDVPHSTLNATNITINGLLQQSSSPTVSVPVKYFYDDLGRQTRVQNSLGFSSTVTYNGLGQVAGTADFTGMSTAFEYYPNGVIGAGQVKCQTVAGIKKTWYAYTNVAGLYRVWGDVPFPEERWYSPYGELVELHTYRGGTGWNGSTWPASPGSNDKTTWTYQQHSGLLASKTDHLNRSVAFSYTNALLRTKTWARGGVTVTNLYNDLGELVAQDYSDTTPDVRFVTDPEHPEFNRLGQPKVITDATGAWSCEYDHAGRLTKFQCTSSTIGFQGIILSNRFNQVYGRDRILATGIGSDVDTTYGFDPYGRLATVVNGSVSVEYAYLANSDLLQTTTSKYSSAPILTTTRGWDFGARLRSIASTVGASTVNSYTYTYDALNRRTRAMLADQSAWAYDYDDRNEVIGGRHFWADFSPVSGQQYSYAYDHQGNRTQAGWGGDVNGASLRTTGYGRNELNQYTTITNQGYLDISGLVWATNTITVNGQATDRKGEYWHAQLSVANTNQPVLQSVSAVAGSTTNSGFALVPPNTRTLSYDHDGNLIADGLWTYTWDGENRLTKVESATTLAATNRLKIEFQYDHQGRRVSKKSCTHSGSSYVIKDNLLLVYDGWNLVAELNATNKAVIRSFAWGLDLANALPGADEGAGGIGGLVLVKSHVSPIGSHFPAYDGNGNVTALVDTGGNLTARYEYGPFGEPITVWGAAAKLNPFRWSTKATDSEADLVYYGYRYYSPRVGRWISRDPFEEEGGFNLYVFTRNNPPNALDPNGGQAVNPDLLTWRSCFA